MRQLSDKGGMKLQIDQIQGVNSFSGMIEGTPYLMRKFRLHCAKPFAEKPGHIFDSVEALEKDLESCEPDSVDWPEKEHWTAEISNGTSFDAGRDTFSSRKLTVGWYQEGDDPFERLREIMTRLYFREVSRIETWNA